MIKFKFDNLKYDFAWAVSDKLGGVRLSTLHKESIKNAENVFYQSLQKEPFSTQFDTMFSTFIREHIVPRHSIDILYQKLPAISVQTPNHEHRTYRIVQEEVLYYMPLTDAWDTNTLWAKTLDDDYKPVEASYGEIVEIRDHNLDIKTKNNTTDSTRVSFIFRVTSCVHKTDDLVWEFARPL